MRDPAFTEPRRKLHLLANDLERLGLPAAELDRLPVPTVAPFTSAPMALGSMYVIEGSMLGGALIARHVRATLGHDPAYHAGYGRATGAMWRAFQDRLAGAVPLTQAADTVATASATFRQLRVWLTAD